LKAQKVFLTRMMWILLQRDGICWEDTGFKRKNKEGKIRK